MKVNNDLLIIYGTETGNSELLAMDAKKLAKNHGIEARYFAMDEIEANDLKKASTCLVICSTWGDGEQPDNAQELYDDVCSFEKSDLSGLKYAVLALGDTAFDLFCEAGIQWDDVMAEKGAFRLHDRLDCDTDYDDYYEEWMEELFEKIESNKVSA